MSLGTSNTEKSTDLSLFRDDVTTGLQFPALLVIFVLSIMNPVKYTYFLFMVVYNDFN